MSRWSLPLYRLRLGWLLGHRFMLITHVGRKSGKTRRTCVMVLRFDGGQALGNAILIQGNLAGAALTIPFAIAAILEGRDLMRAGPAPQTPRSEASLTSRLPSLSRREPGGALRR